MPIYEYVCRSCQHGFEALVNSSGKAACPQCESDDLQKQMSVVARASSSSSFASASSRGTPAQMGCGTCGDPRGPGACNWDN
jgi:putative FmdB family regulatory protein